MKNVILSYYQLDKFKKIPFDSSFHIDALEYKNANVHRVVFHLYGHGQGFGANELMQLRQEIKKNLSLSWIGNFAFGLVLHDFVVTEDYHYEMVDQWNRAGGACIWAIVIDETIKQATGIHTWHIGTTSNIFEDYLREYPQFDGTILNKYKTPPSSVRWLDALSHPWFFFSQKTRPWNFCPRFLPPFDRAEPQKNDGVVGFGYKMKWYAFRSQEPMRVAEMLGVKNPHTTDWQTGLDQAYQQSQHSVFITPPIDGWVLAAGWGVPDVSVLDDTDRKILEALSNEFGEVQFFFTHRIVEFHCWIKAAKGKIVRAYMYTGESGETRLNEGMPTDAEKPYQLVDTNSPEAQNDEYWEHKDFVAPDEEFVMYIAANWSVDPTELENREGIANRGLLGKIEDEKRY